MPATKNKIILLASLFFFNNFSFGSVQPANNAVINYTQVMFEYNEQPGADSYSVTCFSSSVAFSKTFSSGSLAILVQDELHFGHSYRWYFQAYSNGREIYKSDTFNFSIAGNFLITADEFRYNVLKKREGEYTNNLVLLDQIGVALNRNGIPVWYMPFDSAIYEKRPQYRNLSITPQGSFTYLRYDQCVEKDLQGKLLWQAPDDGRISGDSKEYYHHDFIKRSNGNFMVCSYRYDSTPSYYDSALKTKVRYNTIIEYDKKSRPVWSWNEKDHVDKSELFDGTSAKQTMIPGTHMNGFAINEKEKIMVASFRNSSSLAWIDMKTGKILKRLFGEGPKKTDPGIFFSGQHSPVITPGGNLLLYNNNASAEKKSSAPVYPTVVMLSQPLQPKTEIKKIWEFECRFDDLPGGLAAKEGFASELPNSNILVCLGGAGKIFEVNRKKEIVWEMNCDSYDRNERKWIPLTNYRTHFISSLYPYYFTVQHLPVKNAAAVRINNNGTETDEYIIETYAAGNPKAAVQRIKIAAAGTAMIRVPSPQASATAKTKAAVKPVKFIIRSVHNTAMTREIIL